MITAIKMLPHFNQAEMFVSNCSESPKSMENYIGGERTSCTRNLQDDCLYSVGFNSNHWLDE